MNYVSLRYCHNQVDVSELLNLVLDVNWQPSNKTLIKHYVKAGFRPFVRPLATAFQYECEKLDWDVKGGEIARENEWAEAQIQNLHSEYAVEFVSCCLCN
jgi:hypothetical protein